MPDTLGGLDGLDASSTSRPMIGSIFKFVSDWMSGDVRQPPPFRHATKSDETAVELQMLVRSEGNDPDPIKKELSEWKNITNIDAFLEQLYAYYLGNGIYGVIVKRLVNLLIIGFLVAFTLFLVYVVDWKFIHHSATAAKHPTLSQVIKFSGLASMSWLVSISLAGFSAIWILQWVRLVQEIPRLLTMSRFYTNILRISEDELQAVEFSDIMAKITSLQEKHRISADKLDARDICNRLMRRENYLIALFNKEIFNVDLLPIKIKPSMNLTKTLEWNLSFCILNYVFDSSTGSIRKGFVKNVQRDRLSEELKRRFIAVGIANLILAPFIFIMLCAYFLFKYGEEIYRSPRTIATRQYTTAAKWCLREFNELPHLFDRRLSHSHSKANKYMEQFGNSRWTPLARLVAFITGSFAVVLLALTVVNEDLLMHFEITAGKSIIWYLGLMGVILAISRAMIPDAGRAHDPKKLMESIIEYTHYLPKHWRGLLHARQVHREFSGFYDYKFLILFNELISVLITPFILIFALPKCSDRLVDFFREFTVHVDGIDYVCSFALFDFVRHGNPKYGGGAAPDKQNRTKQGKMEKSFLSFVANNPKWSPDELGSQFLGRIGGGELVGFTGNQRSSSPLSKIPMGPTSFKLSPRLAVTAEEEIDEDGEVMYSESSTDPAASGIISILNKYYDQQSTTRFD